MTNDARGSGLVAPASSDNRTTLRKRVRLRARLRGRGSTSFDIDVVDLSPTGFRAATVQNLRSGTIVWINLPGLAAIEAEVAWQSHEFVGGAFRQPLHPAVFDHIVALGV